MTRHSTQGSTQASTQLQVYLDRAVRKLKQGELVEAEDACHAAMEAVPGDYRPLRILAAVDQRRGDSRRAIERLETVLGEHEDDPALWRQLGVLYASRGNNDAAVRAFKKTLDIKPHDDQVLIRLADIERQRGNGESARRYAEEVLSRDPANSDAQWIVKVLQAESPEEQAARREHEALFGQALRAQYKGDIKRAETLYRSLVKRDALHFPALHLLGVLLAQVGRAVEACEFLRRACSVRKTDPDAWNNLAAAQALAGEHRASIDSLRKALKLRPAFAEAYNNLGRSLTMLNRFDDAARSFRRAIKLHPDYLDAHANLGDLYLAQGSNADAASTYADALKYAPGHPIIETQRGTSYFRLGRRDDAMKCFERALARQPDFAPAHVNRGFLLLSKGEYNQGWTELEWRFRDNRFTDGPARHLPEARRWRGGSVANKRLLVYTEGTPGETLMLMRYLASLKARRATVILWCAPPWALLFRQWGVADEIHASAKVPDASSYDVFVPMLSLPQVMATDLDSVPPPLKVLPPGAMPASISSLTQSGGPKVGFVWDAALQTGYRYDHCCPAEAVKPLLALSQLRFFGFEKIPESYGNPANLIGLHGKYRNVDELVAAVSAMDCVIGVDSTIVHIALAMGKPTWVLLGTAPDWAWTLGRANSVWYPEARLLKVGADGDWRAVFAQLAQELSPLK